VGGLAGWGRARRRARTGARLHGARLRALLPHPGDGRRHQPAALHLPHPPRRAAARGPRAGRGSGRWRAGGARRRLRRRGGSSAPRGSPARRARGSRAGPHW
jgi:hypothetical protein